MRGAGIDVRGWVRRYEQQRWSDERANIDWVIEQRRRYAYVPTSVLRRCRPSQGANDCAELVGYAFPQVGAPSEATRHAEGAGTAAGHHCWRAGGEESKMR